MSEIGVIVTKAVRIDRDGARSLLKAFAEWVEPTINPGDVETFLRRYADLPPEEAKDDRTNSGARP